MYIYIYIYTYSAQVHICTEIYTYAVIDHSKYRIKYNKCNDRNAS
jgi:hypothetical protein